MMPKTKLSEEEILQRTLGLVASSLALKSEDISGDSLLIPDLGADSLDFVDLIFMLESEFGIKIRDGEFDFISKLDFSAPEIMKNGHLTSATVENLLDSLPALKDVPDPTRVTPSQLFSLISVETLCRLVKKKLG